MWLFLPAAEREVIVGDLEERWSRGRAAGETGLRRRYWRHAIGSIASRIGRLDRSPSSPPDGVRRGVVRRIGGGVRGDLRCAVRQLRVAPRHTVVVIVTLALGIGANTAVFSVVNEALLRPMPGVGAWDRVGWIDFRTPADGQSVTADEPGQRSLYAQSTIVRADELADLRAWSRDLEIMAYSVFGLHMQPSNGMPMSAMGAAVVGDWFGALGVRAAMGRLPGPAELGPDADPTIAVISEILWSTVFGRDPAIVERTLWLNGMAFTVVGVAGGGFRGVSRAFDVDVWVPASAASRLLHRPDPGGRPTYYGLALGRVRDGVTFDEASTDLERVWNRVVEAHAGTRGSFISGSRARLSRGIDTDPAYRDRTVNASRLLLVVVSLVLLIACANVTNLLLYRGLVRQSELTVRRALGASRLRVAGQLLVESSLLAVPGGALGVLIAVVLGRVLEGHTIVGVRDFHGVRVDPALLVFALAVTGLTVLLAGVAPAFIASRDAPAGRLRATSGRQTAGGGWLRTSLVTVQLSLALAVTVSALLLTRSVANLYSVDLGFDPSGVDWSLVDLSPEGLSPPQAGAVVREALGAIRSMPEVESAAVGTTAPFLGIAGALGLVHPDRGDTIHVDATGVSAGWFETLGVRFRSGRPLDETDSRATGAAVITHALARRLFGDADAVGRTLRTSSPEPATVTIVGVTDDMRTVSPADAPDQAIFLPIREDRTRSTFVVRTRGGQGPATAEVAGVMREIFARNAPGTPAPSLHSLEQGLESRIGNRGVLAQLLDLLALLTVLIAAVGLYGVVSCSVAGRVREIGIRVALGARSVGIAGLMMRRVAVMVGAGIAFGLLAATLLARVIRSQLFGVEPIDGLTFAAGAALFGLLSVIAAAIPVRTAMRVDPVSALRQE